MPLLESTSLIAKPVSFSDGASGIDSTTRWGQDPFPIREAPEGKPRVQFSIVHPHRNGYVEHSFAFHGLGTSGDIDVPDSVKARLLCCWMVYMLPERGLTEAVESLSDLYEFHSRAVELPKLTPPPKSVPVRIGKTIVRPVYPITEED